MQKSVNPKPLYFTKKPCGEPQGWDEKLYIRQSIEWYNIYTVIF